MSAQALLWSRIYSVLLLCILCVNRLLVVIPVFEKVSSLAAGKTDRILLHVLYLPIFPSRSLLRSSCVDPNRFTTVILVSAGYHTRTCPSSARALARVMYVDMSYSERSAEASIASHISRVEICFCVNAFGEPSLPGLIQAVSTSFTI